MKGNFNFLTLFLKVEIHQNIIPRETIDHTIGDKYTNFIYMSQKQNTKSAHNLSQISRAPIY